MTRGKTHLVHQIDPLVMILGHSIHQSRLLNACTVIQLQKILPGGKEWQTQQKFNNRNMDDTPSIGMQLPHNGYTRIWFFKIQQPQYQVCDILAKENVLQLQTVTWTYMKHDCVVDVDPEWQPLFVVHIFWLHMLQEFKKASDSPNEDGLVRVRPHIGE